MAEGAEVKMSGIVWWVRIVITCALVAFVGAVTYGAMQDGSRGANTLPWLLVFIGTLAWWAYPKRKQAR
jgi:hypothetical protein